jgi:enoyl-CoA hydratase/carnithine racemase
MTTEKPILVDRPSERVATIVLNRPDRRNALTGPLADEFGDQIEALNQDDSLSIVVIRGAGGAFCSGLDLKEFNVDPQPDWVPAFGEKWRRVHRALFDSNKVIVGALERAAVNGGAALALACDFLIAGETAFLQVGEVQQGMAAPMNMAWLRLRHSEALAARLAIVGDRLTGPQLVDLGLAHASVADDQVLAEVDRFVERLAANDVMGMQRIKTSLRRTGLDATAEEWFAKALAADPLAGRPMRPIAAEDK